MYPYLPHTEEEIKEMLETIGVSSVNDLFSNIDEELKINKALKIPDRLSEIELEEKMIGLAKENHLEDIKLSFVGGGVYEHYIPSIIPYLTSRQEFSTAYTPYQPEISQGTLQAIYEYQSMICMLTGLDVSNASHYDGSTATAEAVLMACTDKRRKKCIVSGTVNEETKKVIQTYTKFKGIEYIEVPHSNGVTDHGKIQELMNKEVACVVVQSPNCFGIIEDLSESEAITHGNKGLFIMNANPTSLSVLKSPKEWGADIAVGEGQVLGNSMNFGGAYLGYMTCTTKLMRKMPGRIVGETKDIDGKRGYVLTLQAREQHIRREKATSNITSNQALNALAATIYMATMGKEGLKEVAKRSMKNAKYLATQLEKRNFGQLKFKQPYYNEFLFEFNQSIDIKSIMRQLADQGILLGIDWSDEFEGTVLMATTEMHHKSDLDTLLNEMEAMR